MATGSSGNSNSSQSRQRGSTGASRRRPLRSTTDRAAQEAVGF